MLTFSFLTLVLVTLIYAVIGMFILRLADIRVNLINIIVFIISGGTFCFLAVLIFGMLVADPTGQLTSTKSVIVFLVSIVLSAFIGSGIGIWIARRKR